jgi:2-amino-4-hydroxy-6-hydroxymethyldihydropteridine diphosphokinase
MDSVAVYLGLGANMGEKQENLQKALDYISQRMRIEKKSSIYDAAPMENTNQPRFLNMACQATTSVPANMLLFLIKGIEAKLGRLPGPLNGPRIIDIDILLYGDSVINTPDLKVPHPRMAEREFVLAPLSEIAPDVIHPVAKKTIMELYEAVKGKQGVNRTNFK